MSCTAVPPGKPLAIAFSASANGILSSCHCPNSPWGGLAKRAWLLDQLRTAAGSNRVIALDSGDLFPLDSNPARAYLMLQLFDLMHYQAVGIGDQELVQGLVAWVDANRNAGFWNETIGKSTFPWLSGGYRLTTGPRRRQMLVPPWTFVECNGMRVGIASITGPEAWRFAQSRPAGVELVAPERVIAAFLEEAREQIDLAVVLSHQGAEADRELARKISGIDLIIGGHSQSLISPPEIVNGIAICQAGKNGENLGVLAIIPRSGRETPPKTSSVPAVAETRLETSTDPFQPTVVQTPRWTIAQQIVPLTPAIEDSAPAAQLIAAYYADGDHQNAKRLSMPAPDSKSSAPQLILDLPSEPLVLHTGENQTVELRISNPGGAPLLIERVRSKSPWLSVQHYPTNIAPGTNANVIFEVSAEKIDRFFRCEFSVLANDPQRRVVQAAFPGRMEGPLKDILDVAVLWSNLANLINAPLPPPRLPPSAPEENPQASNSVVRPASGASSADLAGEKVGVPAGGPPTVARTHPPRPAPDPTSPAHRVLVEFFFAPGCTECKEVERQVLPAVLDRFGPAVNFRKLDVSVSSNYLRLATLQERLSARANEPVSVYVDECIAVLGLDAIHKDLESIIAARLTDHPAPAPVLPPEDSSRLGSPVDVVPRVLADRLHSFTLPTVMIAGLVDGINPCAFATIVFFITLLGVSGVTGRRLLPVGAGYVLGGFGTYLLMGFCAFHALQALQVWIGLADMLQWGMLGVLVLLALLSFRDAWRFRQFGQAVDVSLKLPNGLKRRIHDTMRRRLNPANLFLSALGIGVLVTLIEAVCTGQVYLPTLVLLSRYAETRARAIPLLLAYNLMFILPLLVVLLAALAGTRSQRLVKWSRHNVIWGKMAMGLLFVCLAVVLILT